MTDQLPGKTGHLTPEQIARLRAMEQAGTAGPWDVVEVPSADTRITWRPDTEREFIDAGAPICHMRWFSGLGFSNVSNDAAIIAAARNALPALLDSAEECERLRGMVAVMAETLTAIAYPMQHIADSALASRMDINGDYAVRLCNNAAHWHGMARNCVDRPDIRAILDGAETGEN